MPDQQDTGSMTMNPEQFCQAVAQIAQRWQKVAENMMDNPPEPHPSGDSDPMDMAGLMERMGREWWRDPAGLAAANSRLMTDSLALWGYAAQRWMGGSNLAPVVAPAADDRRFNDSLWSDLTAFDTLKQGYLLWSRYVGERVEEMTGLDEQDARKARFISQQIVDLLSPSNFPVTNPEVLSEAMDSGGESLLRGLDNLLRDMENGAVTMTDRSAFTVGENIAGTEGKVVYRTELMELIQYAPSTPKVYGVPLLIIPPWINKFYILDLRAKNSFVKWAVDQGHTVFMVSWVNPDKELADKSFEDYMLQGSLAAIDTVCRVTGQDKLNVIGYCLGGTLTAATLAHLRAKGDQRVNSVTLLTTLVDFEKAGELKVFIDERQVSSLEADMREKGFLDGSKMSNSFNTLRANDLVWSFFIHNYLLGRDPFPFDLLYWNADSTRMPQAMHSYYLRRMYMENALSDPGAMELLGTPIDLGTIDMPAYILSTKEDHIAPWVATYQAARLFSGKRRFVLSESGHIAGVVNPPASRKYGYWTGPDSFPIDPEAWFAEAEHHQFSWWNNWQEWIKPLAGGRRDVPARIPGDGQLPALCDAPGEYVMTQV